jgi:acyl-coenzyme A synthetase/AMP-(fatty) acid ligase
MFSTLHEMAMCQAESRPLATAIVCGRQTVTFAELEAMSNRLARLFVESDIEPGARICTLLGKSPRAIMAQLAILKAGCVCVPIDTTTPLTRIKSIISRCEPDWLVSEAHFAGLIYSILNGTDGPHALRAGVLWLDHGPWIRGTTTREVDTGSRGGSADTAPEIRGDGAAPAYVFCSMGSDGRLKGSVLTHANIRHSLEWAVGHFDLTPRDRITAHNPLHCGLSLFDVFGALWSGATIHLLQRELDFTPHRLAEAIRNGGMTHWLAMPSTLSSLAKLDLLRDGDFSHLRQILWCGGELHPSTVGYWMTKLPHVAFTNLYGCSELAVAASYYTVPEPPEAGTESVPIGVACPGQILAVLDDQGQQAPAGEVGELYVGGTALGRDCLSGDDGTSSAIAMVNLSPAGEAVRLLRTGDLASRDEDGIFRLHGRSESLIEVDGRRDCTVDVERILNELSEIQECVVVSVEDKRDQGKLVCCAYVPVPRNLVTPHQLQYKLSQRVPAHLIPPKWLSFPNLPRTANGKVDRWRLKRLFSGS